jgi:acyl-homoserine lactone acylase PvdQ
MFLDSWVVRTSILAISICGLGLATLFMAYQPLREGTVFLQKAEGNSTLVRESETGIQHIKADTLTMAVYTQGFGHAQDRLW